jgi:hypothetical protein
VPGPEFKPLIAKTFFFQKLKKKKKQEKKKVYPVLLVKTASLKRNIKI